MRSKTSRGREVYEQIKGEYSSFLESIGITASNFIPASGRAGDNIIGKSPNIPWFGGPSILGQLDSFKQKPSSADRPFRMPVQDIYKFTDFGDDRRIIAGTVETGKVRVGDRVVFLPSGKESEIAGGGIIIDNAESGDSLIRHHIIEREYSWEKGMINESDRVSRNSHKSKFIIITGDAGDEKRILAKKLEYLLFMLRLDTYYLGVKSIFTGLDSDMAGFSDRDEHVRRIGELARIMTDAGLIFITVIDDLDGYDVEKLRLLNSPNESLVVSFGGDAALSDKADLNLLSDHPMEESLNSIMNVLYGSGVIYEK